MSYSDHRSRDYERERGGSHRSSHHHSSSSHHHHHHHNNNNNGSSSNANRGGVSDANYPVYDERDKYAGDYISICLKNLIDTLTDTELSDAIYREFRKFGNFNVKVVYDRNMTRDKHAERIAFVNFDTHEQAREAKRVKLNINFHGLPLYIEPVFRNRSNAPPPQHQKPHDRHYSSSDYHRSAPKSSGRINTPPLPLKSSRHNKSRSLSPPSTSHSRNSSISRSPDLTRRRRGQQHINQKSIRSPPIRSKRRNSRTRSRSRSLADNIKTRKSRNEIASPPPPSRRQHYQHHREMYMSPPPPPPPPYHRHQNTLPPPPPHYSNRHLATSQYMPRHGFIDAYNEHSYSNNK